MPVNSDSDQTTLPLDDSATANVIRSGNVVRLNVPVPFFMRNGVFGNFSRSDYSWDSPVNEKQKIVLLVAAEDKNKYGHVVDSSKVSPVISKEKKNVVEYSIGGCPLECPFDLNENFDEALDIDTVPLVFEGLKIPNKYFPFSVDEGKNLVRKITVKTETLVKELNLDKDGWPSEDTPLLTFLDGFSVNSGLTLFGFRRPFKFMNVHLMGRHRPEERIFEMQSIRRFHIQNLMAENKPVTSVAHAIYEKLQGEYPSYGKVYLEFLFKEPSNIFDLPPKDSSSKVAIKPMPGDANPFLKELWEEVQDLERWINILAQFSERKGGNADVTSFLNSTAFDFNENRMTANTKAVQDLLNQEPAIDLQSSSSNEFSDSLHSILQKVIQQERVDCDFTDRLWSVVRKCESVEELQDCLQIVFQTVSNKMYRPYLLLNNETTMAKNLTLVMKGEMGCLLQIRCHEVMVKLLIECGLLKLYKDYNFVLAMSHLIERGEVDRFIPSVSNVVDSLWKVKKLHCILEVICLSKERLSLSINILERHVKKMLDMFSGPEPFNWEQTYHFDVPSNDLFRVMHGLHPIYYKVKMDSKTLLKWATTTVVVSLENYICYKKNLIDEANLRQYYVYVMCEYGRLEG